MRNPSTFAIMQSLVHRSSLWLGRFANFWKIWIDTNNDYGMYMNTAVSSAHNCTVYNWSGQIISEVGFICSLIVTVNAIKLIDNIF